MSEFLHSLSAALRALGPWGVFLLSIIDSVGIPLPAAIDGLVISVAALSAKSQSVAWFTAFMAILGSAGGNAFLFLGVRHGSRLWKRSEEPESPGRRRKFREWFDQYGLLTVFIPAVVPVLPLPLKVFVISAGLMGTPFWRFFGVVLLARCIRYLGEAWLGLQLGEDAQGFLVRNAWLLTTTAIAMTAALYVLMRPKRDQTEPRP